MVKAADPGTLLFVVGVWRSGTSLVHALLNRHPQVRLMYEAEPFGLWPRRTNAFWPKDWRQRLEFYNQTMSRHQLDAANLTIRVAREAALELYCAFGKQRGATIIGEKAPAYHACLPAIARIFPHARFVIIWRDPLECCRSAARAGRDNRFFAQRGMMRRMLFGSEAMARGVERLQREGAFVHEVAYPEFVADPEKQLRRICDFAQIPFDPRMLDLKGADVSVLPAGEHHERVRSGVIGRTAEEKEKDPLPATFSAKGQRYTALWRDKFAELGFSRAVTVGPEQARPGWGEQWLDRTVNLISDCRDGIKRWLFRRIPLSWWGRLRGPGVNRSQRRKTEELAA